jgi:hypothetical protein
LHGAAASGGVESFPQLKTSAFSAVSRQIQQFRHEMAGFRTGTDAFRALSLGPASIVVPIYGMFIVGGAG